MIDSVLLLINQWLGQSPLLALPGAFLWGLVSVLLSPCHLASIPLLIAYVAGQDEIPSPRRAARFAILFAIGIFLTIMAVGLICTALGRMMGDVGPWWQSAVGFFVLWVAWTLFQPPKCSTSSKFIDRFQFKGEKGAFLLGLAYGIMSGVCTFGFLAPILGMITLYNKVVGGITMLMLFGAGHCLPLVLCGMFSARAMEILHAQNSQNLLLLLRKAASLVLAVLGIYFIYTSF